MWPASLFTAPEVEHLCCVFCKHFLGCISSFHGQSQESILVLGAGKERMLWQAATLQQALLGFSCEGLFTQAVPAGHLAAEAESIGFLPRYLEAGTLKGNGKFSQRGRRLNLHHGMNQPLFLT